MLLVCKTHLFTHSHCSLHITGSSHTVGDANLKNGADLCYLMDCNLNCRHPSSQWRYYNTLIKLIDGLMIQQVSRTFLWRAVMFPLAAFKRRERHSLQKHFMVCQQVNSYLKAH